MSMDLTFLSDSYMQQILQQLRHAGYQKQEAQKETDFGSILTAKGDLPQGASPNAKKYFIQGEEAALRRAQDLESYYKHRVLSDSIRSDLTGERGVLTDRGTGWISAFAYMGGKYL